MLLGTYVNGPQPSLTRCDEACVVDRLHLVDVELVHDVVQEGVQVVQELDGLGVFRGIRL